MYKYLISLMFVIAIAGCSWAEVEDNAEKTAAGANTAAIAGKALGPVTGGYGDLIAAIASAVSAASVAVAAFARKKKEQVAKAAVEAADAVPGGGKAIVAAATANGVAPEIHTVYKSQK